MRRKAFKLNSITIMRITDEITVTVKFTNKIFNAWYDAHNFYIMHRALFHKAINHINNKQCFHVFYPALFSQNLIAFFSNQHHVFPLR